ncbi:hypothetical protein BH09SUM1_BH09SUM1_18600 [soil metagenome]
MSQENQPSAPQQMQMLFIGVDPTLTDKVLASIGKSFADAIVLTKKDWAGTDWLSERASTAARAVIAYNPESFDSMEELYRCCQIVSISFRPQRLVVMLPRFGVKPVLNLLRTGADGILPSLCSAEDIVRELDQPGIDRAEYFPDPAFWLHSLTRAAEELHLGEDPHVKLKKMLRRFVSQLQVDRGSIAIMDGEGLRLAAIVGSGVGLEEGSHMKLSPESITATVIRTKEAKLLQGAVASASRTPSMVKSAISAPLVAAGNVFGVVNFSSLQAGRALTHVDLVTVEVFASLLALGISNHELYKRSLEAERAKAVAETMHSVSHRLRNLLTVITGSMTLFDRSIERDDKGLALSTMRVFRSGVRRVETLVTDLIDFSSQKPANAQPVDVCAMMFEIASSFPSWEINNKRKLELPCSVKGIFIVDEHRLERSVTNLLANAMEATPADGIVRMSGEETGGELIITVEDTGPGVPPERLAALVDPHQAVGKGIGLAMVTRFCQESGGRLEADCSGELGGLRIRMILPAIHP